MKVSLGSDHRGVHIKARLIQTLNAHGIETVDAGTNSESAVDYPDFAQCVARQVSGGEADRGILICGTGIGMAITANKFRGVRAAPCCDEVMVEMSRRHNDVNVLCLPGDLIGERPIDELVLMWLRTEFEGGRHAKRVAKIVALENSVECSRSNERLESAASTPCPTSTPPAAASPTSAAVAQPRKSGA